ncbi:MAG: DUF177 domain-containing protein [Lachnospiraceae bacterium]|nr:DUF177 domain-containing protein [Lachnospiraceae bacterium]
MFINLTDVLTSEDKVVTMQAETDMAQVNIGVETFRIAEKTPIGFTFTNIGRNKALIECEAELVFSMSCDRCLKPVENRMILHFSRSVASADEETLSDEDDDRSFMDGDQLVVEDLLNNEIMINWPMKVLCKPDCKGICPKCGKDLNTGDCGCDTFVPDPRMAKIKDIFNGNKEV